MATSNHLLVLPHEKMDVQKIVKMLGVMQSVLRPVKKDMPKEMHVYIDTFPEEIISPAFLSSMFEQWFVKMAQTYNSNPSDLFLELYSEKGQFHYRIHKRLINKSFLIVQEESMLSMCGNIMDMATNQLKTNEKFRNIVNKIDRLVSNLFPDGSMKIMDFFEGKSIMELIEKGLIIIPKKYGIGMNDFKLLLSMAYYAPMQKHTLCMVMKITSTGERPFNEPMEHVMGRFLNSDLDRALKSGR